MFRRNPLLIMAAAICWGTIPVFYHVMSAAGLSNMQTITLRFSFAALGYFCYLAVRDPSLLIIQRPIHLLYFVGTGVCSLAFFNFCYITCIRASGVAPAALLLYTAPVFVMLMSALLFGEKLTVRSLIALGMTVVGCAFVAGAFSGDMRMSPSALLWGLASGFGYALYSIFGKLALRHYRAETITAWTALFAAAATLPLSDPIHLPALMMRADVLFSALGCALICTVLAYLLYTAGLAHVPAGQAAILSTLEPVAASILGIVLLDETIDLAKICGFILVFGSVAVLNTANGSFHSTDSQ